jgi:mono/diheme cytochrome c family protein
MRTVLLLFALLGGLIPGQLLAHPVEAEPVNHPYVYTFDQFHLPMDDADSLARGGLLLMAEARCTACHTAPQGWKAMLQHAPGPDLSEVGSRLKVDELWLFVRSPQHRKRGTLMPGMFGSGPAEDVPEKVEAIAQYLLSLRAKVPSPQLPQGDVARGQQLYHSVGCVACHEPAKDVRPAGLPAEMQPDRPGNASVPIAFADWYDASSLGRFLLNPHTWRPASRMPGQHLTAGEAADIAAYLHVGRKEEVYQERGLLQIPPQSVEQGKQLFAELRCVQCHSTGQTHAASMARPLLELKADSAYSCIAEKLSNKAESTPRYQWNALQRQCLNLALSLVQKPAKQVPLSREQRIDWELQRLNCYACHDRDGKGAAEDPRAAYFLPKDAAHMPVFAPTLDGIEKKYQRSELEEILSGKGSFKLKHFTARMPQFSPAQVQRLLDALVE